MRWPPLRSLLREMVMATSPFYLKENGDRMVTSPSYLNANGSEMGPLSVLSKGGGEWCGDGHLALLSKMEW